MRSTRGLLLLNRQGLACFCTAGLSVSLCTCRAIAVSAQHPKLVLLFSFFRVSASPYFTVCPSAQCRTMSYYTINSSVPDTFFPVLYTRETIILDINNIMYYTRTSSAVVFKCFMSDVEQTLIIDFLPWFLYGTVYVRASIRPSCSCSNMLS